MTVARIPQMRLLPDGRRLHLQDGPIDLVIEANGAAAAVREAYRAARRRFVGLLDELCAELPRLRRRASPDGAPAVGRVAQRMDDAVRPLAGDRFITPMAAVAGSVADEILAMMIASGGEQLTRAYVNNGGDIAIYLAEGYAFTAGLVDRPDRPSLFATTLISAGDGVGGIATSGSRGRSFSLGIADAVTVLARDAAGADAAATVVANAVDLPGDLRVKRAPANSLQPDSDLGALAVTCSVPTLLPSEIDVALANGLAVAEVLIGRRLIAAAALRLQGRTCVADGGRSDGSKFLPRTVSRAAPKPKHVDTFEFQLVRAVDA